MASTEVKTEGKTMAYALVLAKSIEEDGQVREESAKRFKSVIRGLEKSPARSIAALIDMRNSGELREEANDRYQAILSEYRTFTQANPDHPDAEQGDDDGDDGDGQADAEDALTKAPPAPTPVPAPAPAPKAAAARKPAARASARRKAA